MAALADIRAKLPLGPADRRRLAERVAALRPAAAAKPGFVVAGTGRSRSLLAPVRAVADPLLGIDRSIASDEGMALLPPLGAGVAAAVLAELVLGRLLALNAALVLGAAVLAAVAAARALVEGRRAAIRATTEEQFALALGVIIRCVRAGLPVNEGMRAAATEVPAPTGPEFRRAVDQIQLGEGFDAALQGLAARCALPDYRFFAVSVSLQRQTGGNLAETLDNLAETIRKRRAVRLKAQALTSETRATVLVLAVLPLVVGGVLMVVNPAYVMQLFATESGRQLLGIAILVQLMGLAVIRFLSGRSLS